MNESEVTGVPDSHRVKVQRKHGDCDYCDATGIQVVTAYEDRIYEGQACPECILRGRASKMFGPDHPVMRPMVFVARALRGDEPFHTLLKNADRQRENPEAAEAEMDRIKDANRLRRAGLLAGKVKAAVNRKARRAAKAIRRKS